MKNREPVLLRICIPHGTLLSSHRRSVLLTHTIYVPILKTMEVRLSTDLQSKLARLAAQQGRDSAALVVEAVERLVDYDAWFTTEVEKGLAQIDSGQTLSHEQVGSRLSAYLAQKQL